MNLIFDLGGVVFTWNPAEIITRVFKDRASQALVREKIFGHPDWDELDRGTLSYPQATLRAAARTGLPEALIANLFDHVPLALVGMPETVSLLRRLKHRGHRLFYLSNMHTASINYLESAYTFWDIFEGGVISCRSHWIKPEMEIYSFLLEQIGLDDRRTIFIDDLEQNLVPAASLGWQTVRFENPVQCESQLKTMGCI